MRTPLYRPSRAGDLIGYNAAGRPLYLPGGGSPEHEPGTTPPGYAFPFAVPDDLSTLDDASILQLLTDIAAHARSFAALPPDQITDDTLTALRACKSLAEDVRAVQLDRVDQQAQAAARQATAAELAVDIEAVLPEADPAPRTDPIPDTDPALQTDPAAITAAGRRPLSVRGIAGRLPAPAVPEAQAAAVMTAAADVPNFAAGQQLATFAEAGRALHARLAQYPAQSTSTSYSTGSRRPVTAYDPDSPGRTLTLERFARHSAVQIRRQYPADLRITSEVGALAVVEHAASERRLPGGNLRESARLALAAGRSLTAAQGWCAPSQVIYDLCELETRDGILDLPEVQSDRGGFQIPANGGPAFATIWSGIGSAGDTHLTEAEVIADTSKVCYEIPCPDFTDVRLGVDYVCLTGGLLQRRGYPEVVERFGRGAMIALDHKINQGVIAAIVAAAGAATALVPDLSGDDAVSALLAAVEMAIIDAKYRNRMGFNSTLEIVLPMWVLGQMRAAASRRSGVDMVGVDDARILEWFTMRGAVPRFVYDWQDAFSGLVGGPGGAAALSALPTSVEFLVYPAGTFVKAMQEVVALDTIYDSTLLQANQYTAVFAEDGWAVLQMCPYVHRYSVPVDPSGVVGCCPANLTS